MRFIDTSAIDSPAGMLVLPLRRLEKSLGIYVTVHDCRGVYRNSRGNPLLPEYNSHRHPFCTAGRVYGGEWGRRCYRECCTESDALAISARRPFLKRCWKGVVELVVPIVRDDTLMLTVYAGAFRDPSEGLPGEFPAELLDEYEKLALPDEATITEICGVLRLFGQGILECLDRVELPGGEKDMPRKRQIFRFITSNAHKRIGLKELAQHLCLSPSRTSHLVKSFFGSSFQELVLREKMNRARILLQSGDFSLAEVAQSSGVDDIYYFSRLFRRFFGVSPGRFRKEFRDGTRKE